MKITENASGFNGRIHYVVRKKGKVIEDYDNHNLIVTSGRQRMAELLTGLSTSHITHVGVGTGTAAAEISDIGLTHPVLVPVTNTVAENKVARFSFMFDTATANGMKITEFGLFAGDGTMFSHRVRNGSIDKENDVEIEGYWEIRF